MTALATDSGRTTPARLAGSAILALQSDDRLVRLVRSGHERAFDAIVERYRKPLVRYCARILPESRCEDAVQQAFLNAHAALLGSDEGVQLKPWLFAITRNAALNMLRQNGWNYEQIPADFDGVRRPDQVVEQRIELEQTVAAVNELPERQRSALVMREFEGRSYAEIALALGAADGAVRQLLNRARVTLRNAASALVPPPLVARAASSVPPADGRRVAELAGGLGAAGIAKAGATALVAGSLVVGAVSGPLPGRDHHKPAKASASERGHSQARTAAVADPPGLALGRSGKSPAHERSAGHGHRGRGSDDSLRRDDRRHEHSGSGGSDDRSSTSRGSDDGRHSGSGESGTSGSGGSGSDDGSHSGSDTSGSDTSGSGTSGSGDSGSGSGSSGSDDLSVTSGSGSGTSDSDDLLTGGSGSSETSGGSGTSGSGSDGSSGSGSGTTELSGSSGSGSRDSG